MKPIEREVEIHKSFATGAKALAMGAVLLLVVATVGTPDGARGFAGIDGAVAEAPAVAAPAAGEAAAAGTIPADVNARVIAPERGEPDPVPAFVGG